MFERFTERSRQVVVLAQRKARACKHEQVEPIHLLWGLWAEEEGVGRRVLNRLLVTVDQIESGLPEHGTGSPEQVPFSPPGKKALEGALREALSMGHNYIGTEHLLLGLVAVADPVVSVYLDYERVRHEVAE